MASEVDICNLALAHLGETATVASLDPPEGSAQAEHCARFYPIARDALLEMHTWGFATKRVQLALIGSGWPEWNYAYAQPSEALNIIAVLPQDATDDYSVAASNGGEYVPQAYSCESDDSGNSIILTDQENAVLRYTGVVTDTTKFSPLFVMTLSWSLASMLAGPVLKGDAGAAESKRCELMAFGSDGQSGFFGKAVESDAAQRRTTLQHNVPWISRR